MPLSFSGDQILQKDQILRSIRNYAATSLQQNPAAQGEGSLLQIINIADDRIARIAAFRNSEDFSSPALQRSFMKDMDKVFEEIDLITRGADCPVVHQLEISAMVRAGLRYDAGARVNTAKNADSSDRYWKQQT